MTDHKAEAERNLGTDNWSPGEHAAVEVAQVHAMLYLAEQQRIANLIAYAAICQARGARDDAYLKLDQSVREGLGIA